MNNLLEKLFKSSNLALLFTLLTSYLYFIGAATLNFNDYSFGFNSLFQYSFENVVRIGFLEIIFSFISVPINIFWIPTSILIVIFGNLGKTSALIFLFFSSIFIVVFSSNNKAKDNLKEKQECIKDNSKCNDKSLILSEINYQENGILVKEKGFFKFSQTDFVLITTIDKIKIIPKSSIISINLNLSDQK